MSSTESQHPNSAPTVKEIKVRDNTAGKSQVWIFRFILPLSKSKCGKKIPKYNRFIVELVHIFLEINIQIRSIKANFDSFSAQQLIFILFPFANTSGDRLGN